MSHSRFWNIVTQGATGPEVSLYGYIGAWEDFRYAEFEPAFRALWALGQPITFRINSMGGDVLESLAIYDLVRESPVPTIGIVSGMAASAAGWVFQACTQRHMTENSFVMVHRVHGCSCGTSDDMRQHADLGDKLEARIRSIYEARTGQPAAVVAGWFEDASEKWLTAQECVDLGLADRVVTPPVVSFQNVFHMDFKSQVAQALGQPNNAKDEDLVAAVSRMAAQDAAAEAKQVQLRNQVAALQTKLEAYEKAEADRRAAEVAAVEAEVRSAYDNRLLNESQRDIFLNLAKKEPDTVRQLVSGFTPQESPSVTRDLATHNRAQVTTTPASVGDAVAHYLNTKYPAPKA